MHRRTIISLIRCVFCRFKEIKVAPTLFCFHFTTIIRLNLSFIRHTIRRSRFDMINESFKIGNPDESKLFYIYKFRASVIKNTSVNSNT